MSIAKLENLLIEHGLIEASAIDDPEGYDKCNTKARVSAVWREINDLFRAQGGLKHDEVKQRLPGGQTGTISPKPNAKLTNAPAETQGGAHE